MIKSKFILSILDLLIDQEPESLKLRHQLAFLTDINFDYTGSGLFVRFMCDEKIYTNKIKIANLILHGVLIKSTELKIGADATLFINNGIIDYLEIWSQDGNYPDRELSDYVLSQEWENSPKKQIIKSNKNGLQQRI